jgi:uncharacterized protein (DUF2147 family)
MRDHATIGLLAAAFGSLLPLGVALAQDPAPAAAPAAPAVPRAIIEGTWETQSKTQITIGPCDAGYCGAISKIVIPPDLLEKYKDDIAALNGNYMDYNNKDPALRSRPIQGLEILQVHKGDNPWVFDGQVYNPQDGNIYSGYLQVIDGDRVKLNGCVLYNLICLGEEWVRVPEPPPDASGATDAAGTPRAPVPAEASLRPH